MSKDDRYKKNLEILMYTLTSQLVRRKPIQPFKIYEKESNFPMTTRDWRIVKDALLIGATRLEYIADNDGMGDIQALRKEAARMRKMEEEIHKNGFLPKAK